MPPTIIPDPGNRRRKEKDRSSFYYIYIQQNFAGTILIAQSGRALGGGGVPRGGGDKKD